MGIIRTDQWLKESHENPVELCKKLTSYFSKGAAARDIYQYLKMHGMYRSISEPLLEKLPKNVWAKVEKEYEVLQKQWSGPQIPIFIFPADETNSKIKRDFNGKSGLAFKDKLFLFFSSHNTHSEIKAVLTHEYNHVCRLKKYKKNEADFTLLDTVILEGFAENAVRERCGSANLAGWTNYYSNEELQKLVEQLIIPNRNIKRNERRYTDLLYGKGFYPKMAGYCAGYYLVRNYLESGKLQTQDILGVDSMEFVKEYL
ncbi:DUF2268 domain-containing protein [Bacillus sp. JJ1566]|uniref:DUF2268 domain-containing protein n=1 Tax=Bacillus sp. JJ1566 TaxID=3122961 RepID=UPI002FFF9017